MSSHKLITIIGIWAREQHLNVSDDEADRMLEEASADPNFVAAALFKGGHVAPLSGQEFWLVKAQARP